MQACSFISLMNLTLAPFQIIYMCMSPFNTEQELYTVNQSIHKKFSINSFTLLLRLICVLFRFDNMKPLVFWDYFSMFPCIQQHKNVCIPLKDSLTILSTVNNDVIFQQCNETIDYGDSVCFSLVALLK